MSPLHLPRRLPADDAPGTVLLALPNEVERKQAEEWLVEVGYVVLSESERQVARSLIEHRLDLDIVIAEHTLCVGDNNLFEAVQASPDGLGLVMAGEADVFLITQAMAAGAASFLPHPMTQLDLLSQVALALQRARLTQQTFLPGSSSKVSFEGVVGSSPKMRELMSTLRKAAPTGAPVVILGETGTGKELMARAVHDSSGRTGKFVALHLLAMPAGLIESELFGHKKGAFTGATTDRVGKLELANGGTLFLDELGDIPLQTQAKLLRVLETKEFQPVGDNRTIKSDFRLVGATNRDIEAMIKVGEFRPELWNRMDVVRIELPPLRERRADIPTLVEQFVEDVAKRYGKTIEAFEPEALQALVRYPWTLGNIRELRNKIEKIVVLANGPRISLRDLPRELRPEGGAEAELEFTSGETALAGRTMEDIERDAIVQTLALTEGNRKQAAKLLQIGERTLYRKIEKFDL
ncbi:MAG: sigma-54-dependent Fis family transcriptional regulator [Planctomycetes bacterium]|nr:sigma-54-dependent Fis family transcriptional regulator [Planctomycetota bacterium]